MTTNPTTNYITYNPNIDLYQDLSSIFQPLTGTSSAPPTGFIVNGLGDLSNIFLPLNGGPNIDFSTNFISNGADLSTIFQKYTNTSSSIPPLEEEPNDDAGTLPPLEEEPSDGPGQIDQVLTNITVVP